MKYIIVLIVFFSAATALYGQGPMDISLNGSWKFLADSQNVGVRNAYPNKLPVTSSTVTVPHTWNVAPGLEDYYGKGWYQKDFSAPLSWQGKTVYIEFKAVYHDAEVFLNGQKVGVHSNAGYTPFTLEISRYLHFGQQNILVVSVDNKFSETNLPYKKSFDWAGDGGIIRSVSLHISKKPSVRYVHITPEFDQVTLAAKAMVQLKLNEADVPSLVLNIVCKERSSQKIMFSGKKSLVNNSGLFSFSLNFSKITPWHFDNPFLYELEVEILNKDGLSDTKKVRFGFRKIELQNEQLLLNGEAVRLPGIEYMPGSLPRYGAAEPQRIADSIIRKMKELNMVITRFHWQQDDEMYDLMDERGILVQEEIPWWQAPGKLTPELMLVAKKQLTEMIEAHYNHPSIFAWGLNNEVPSTVEDNTFLKKTANSLDSTRLINIIGNHLDRNMAKDPGLLGDMPTWNEYIGTWNGKNREELPGLLDKVHPLLNNRPLLITEAGLCEPAHAGGDARRIDDMFYHVREWQQHPYIAGFIYFCLNDYRTQMGEEGRGIFQIRRHGIMDVFLQPKPSYSALKQLCAPIEITKVTRLNEADINVSLLVKNSIPSYTVKGYSVRYITSAGKLEIITIPTLKPGGKTDFVLRDINNRYAFEITRPGGTVVASY